MHDDRQGVDTERAGSQSGGMSQPHPAVTPTWVCWADYIALPDDDRRELIDGVLVEVEVPTNIHEWIVSELLFALKLWTRAHGGLVIGSGYKVRIADDRAFMPDLQLYRVNNRAGFIGQSQGLADGAPDLVIEVISPSSRRFDRLLKLQGYAAIEVPEYWIVDPQARTIERLRFVDGTYAIDGGASGDEVLSPKSFPGLEVKLAGLWLDDESEGAVPKGEPLAAEPEGEPVAEPVGELAESATTRAK